MGYEDANLSSFDKEIIFKGARIALQKTSGTIKELITSLTEKDSKYANIPVELVQLLEYWSDE